MEAKAFIFIFSIDVIYFAINYFDTLFIGYLNEIMSCNNYIYVTTNHGLVETVNGHDFRNVIYSESLFHHLYNGKTSEYIT